MLRACYVYNATECLNRELKRCSNVIGVFSNEPFLLRLMGSILIERNNIFQSRRKMFSQDINASLLKTDAVSKLRFIAGEQKHM